MSKERFWEVARGVLDKRCPRTLACVLSPESSGSMTSVRVVSCYCSTDNGCVVECDQYSGLLYPGLPQNTVCGGREEGGARLSLSLSLGTKLQ